MRREHEALELKQQRDVLFMQMQQQQQQQQQSPPQQHSSPPNAAGMPKVVYIANRSLQPPKAQGPPAVPKPLAGGGAPKIQY